MKSGLSSINQKITKNISVCHIYSEDNRLELLDSYADNFLRYDIVDIKDKTFTMPKAHIFILEFEKINNELLKYIQKLILNNSFAHFYLFTDMDTNTSVLKFSIRFGIKNLFSIKIDKAFAKEFFSKSVKKVALDIHSANISYLGKQIDKAYPILIFENRRLSYINSAAKEFYNSDNLETIEQIIKKNKELYSLLNEKKPLNLKLLLEDGQKEYVEVYCSITYNQNEHKTVLSIFENETLIDNSIEELTQNRFGFIEKLKDKIVQSNISGKELYIVIVSIDNGEKLQNLYPKVEYYNFLKEFLIKLNSFKEGGEKIVEWNKNLFILLYEDMDFEGIKNFTYVLHNNIIESQKDSKFSPIITTSFFSILNKDLNSVIKFIDKVDNHTLTSEEIVRENYFEYKFLDDKVDEKEQIKHILYNCINNKIPVKLLNIYKGLCVNTESRVLKYSNGYFYMSCEKLQMYIIKDNNETIIQSPTFPYDIRAKVKFMDIEKSYIAIEKFEFLKNSANNRQNTRVQPTVRIPITIKKDHFVKNGEIIDISINSIAMKIKQDIDKTIEGSVVKAIFKLPNQKSEDGYSLVEIDVTIFLVLQFEDFTKIILKLDEEHGTNSDILQYVFTRQKELVLELKRAIKVM